MPATKEQGALRGLLCAFAAASIGYALEQRDGAFEPSAMLAVGLALIALACAGLGPHALDSIGAKSKLLDARGATILLSLVVLTELALQFARPPGIELHPVRGGPWPFWGGLLLSFALVAAGFRDWLPRARWPLLLAIHFALGAWVIHASPSPEIDVFLFHRAGYAALMDGHSPYASTIPLLYGYESFYGPGMVIDGVVHIGYPYPPLTFAITFFSAFLCGDYRYALLAAVSLSGFCIARLSPPSRARWGELCALLVLFSPRTFFVLEQGWVDPLLAAFICALALSVSQAPRFSTLLLAGVIGVKQYGCFVLPLIPVLLPDENRARLLRRAAIASGIALLVTLPMALFDLRPFVDSVILCQLRQPFRPDALSFAAAILRAGGPELPGWISLAVVLPMIALGLRFAPRPRAANAGGFLAAVALLFAAFFDVAKQAFANYHFLVLVLAAAAASALMPPKALDPSLTE